MTISMKKTLGIAVASFAGTAALIGIPVSASDGPEAITVDQVTEAQQAWGDGIVAISAAHSESGDYRAAAKQHLDTLYNYDNGIVLFKPTLAAEDQFRGTYDEALSYFVTGIRAEDTGFAIKGWTDVRFENEGIYTDDDNAMAMGNYFFTGADGSVTKVEYTFGYVRGDDGELKINTHHSSIPFAPVTLASAGN